jgi:hypothetical protein
LFRCLTLPRRRLTPISRRVNASRFAALFRMALQFALAGEQIIFCGDLTIFNIVRRNIIYN